MIFHFKKGFTLVELMIVIVVIGTLSVSLYPVLSGYLANARSAEIKNNMVRAMREIVVAQVENGTGVIPGLEGCNNVTALGQNSFMQNYNTTDWFLYANNIYCYENGSAPFKSITKEVFPKKYLEYMQKIVNGNNYYKTYNPGICAGECAYIYYMISKGESQMLNYIKMPTGKWFCTDTLGNVTDSMPTAAGACK